MFPDRSRTRASGLMGVVGGWLTVLLLVAAAMISCRRPEPIKIGFVGGLTGRSSDLGVAGRNGVILAVEQINRAGGIHGRRVVLVIRDDKQDPQAARRAVKSLIDQGVVAIIGHMTSAMSVTTVPIINRRKVLMISPTTSTNELAGRDDYFFRVMSPNITETDHLARYAYGRLGLRRMAAVYDLSNRAYSEEYFNNFQRAFTKAGGRMVTQISFTSGRGVNLLDLARRVMGKKPDGVLLVTGAVDTAMICQQLQKLGPRPPVISCGWAMTADLIRNGGSAVEGVVFSHLFDPRLRTKRHLRFKKAFRERFGVDPNFAAVHSYNAARVLFRALLEDGSRGGLKQTIIRLGQFQSVLGKFQIDRFGDAHHQRVLLVVNRGHFEARGR